MDFLPILTIKCAQQYNVCIKYTSRNLICDVITCCVSGGDIGEINVCDKLMIDSIFRRKSLNYTYTLFYTQIWL